MAEEPLYVRAGNAADVLSEIASLYPSGLITVEMARAAHQAASRLQQQAVEAAERDQLIEDLAAFLYRGSISNGDSDLTVPAWGMLAPDSVGRRRCRNLAEDLVAAFDIRRIEIPF